jgi:hypothetical protein
MKAIAGITLILASMVCVVLFALVERPKYNADNVCHETVNTEIADKEENKWHGAHFGYVCGLKSDFYERYDRYYTPITSPDPNNESVKAINAALDCRDILLEVDGRTTYNDLFKMIKEELRRLEMKDIDIGLDYWAQGNAGPCFSIKTNDTFWREDEPSGFPKGMRLRSMLDRILSCYDLTYTIRDESLLITLKDEVYREQDVLHREEMIRKTDPAHIYELSMQTYGMVLAGLVFAWLAYFLSGLGFLFFARDKSSPK